MLAGEPYQLDPVPKSQGAPVIQEPGGESEVDQNPGVAQIGLSAERQKPAGQMVVLVGDGQIQARPGSSAKASQNDRIIASASPPCEGSVAW